MSKKLLALAILFASVSRVVSEVEDSNEAVVDPLAVTAVEVKGDPQVDPLAVVDGEGEGYEQKAADLSSEQQVLDDAVKLVGEGVDTPTE